MLKTYIFVILLIFGLTGLLLWQFPYAISSSDDKGNMFYLLLLALLLSSSALVHYRGKMGQFARHSVIWLLILLIVVTGYSYKHELLNNRIVSSLLPHRAIIDKNGTMLFRAAQDGHFYIEAEINGQKIQFMVDTGASDISISPRDAARIGLNPEKLAYTKAYHTANGIVKAAPVILGTITVGMVTLEHMPASVNSAEMDKSLLGMSFFKKLRGFSVQGDTLTITPLK